MINIKNNFQKVNKISTLFLIVIFILTPIMAVKYVKAIGGTNFGGMKTGTLMCPCTGNQIIYVNDYKSRGTLSLIYEPGNTKLYANKNIMGTYLLGQYESGSGQCKIYVGKDCVEQNSDGKIKFTATS